RHVGVRVGTFERPARGDRSGTERAQQQTGGIHPVHVERVRRRERAAAAGLSEILRDRDRVVAEDESPGGGLDVLQFRDRRDLRLSDRAVAGAAQVVDSPARRVAARPVLADLRAARAYLQAGRPGWRALPGAGAWGGLPVTVTSV